MHILVSGGTGLIGSALCQHLRRQSHSVTVLTRRPREGAERLQYICSLEHCTAPVDMVVNLAGANLAQRRWSVAYKAEIRRSRVELTHRLVAWMRGSEKPPRRLITASAIGYYGTAERASFDESSPVGEGFAATLCQDWEAAADTARDAGVEVVALRLGVVMAAQGSALQKMTQSFRFGVESWLGTGEQWLSWIHLEDAVRVIYFVMAQEAPEAVYNAVAPVPLRHREFAREVGKSSKSLLRLPVPGFVAEALAGEMARELLLSGQRVVPASLERSAFQFNYPTMATALENLLGRPAA